MNTNTLQMNFSASAFRRSKWLQVALSLLFVSGWHPAYAQTTNAPAVAPAVPSLLSNGDFSVATNDPSWPDGWTHPTGGTWESENGIHFVRLKSTTPDAMFLMYRRINLPDPLPPGIELRVRVRYADVVAGKKPWFDARVLGNFKGAEGKEIEGATLPAPAFQGTSTEWVDKSVFARIPPGARQLEIMPCLFNVASGSFDLARVEVFPATEDQLPKPPAPAALIPSTTIVPANPATVPPELHVVGNKLQTAKGKTVWLQGLCLDSFEWGAGEHILQSIPVAIEQWKANAIRLPVLDVFWFGKGKWQKPEEGGIPYRQLIDAAVEAANSRGAYLILDMHQYGWPTDDSIKFWKDAAVRYKNNPGVIFELLNEPHDTTWDVWQKGGTVKVKQKDGTSQTFHAVGMQALVDAVRSTGARNMVIAGGLGWGYDLSGVVKGYALHDQPGGDGIMYSSHIYPWFKDWRKNTLDAAAKHPIFVGEIGTPPDWKGYDFIPMNMRAEDLSKSDWATDVLGMIQKYKLNWTGFSFHPACGPYAISDWNYTPTPYWGVYVKEALGGKQFGIKRMR